MHIRTSIEVQLTELLDELLLHDLDGTEASVPTGLVKQNHRVVRVLDDFRDSLGLLERRDALEVLLGNGLDSREVTHDAGWLLIVDFVVRVPVLCVGFGGNGRRRRRLASDRLEGGGVEDLDVENGAFARLPDTRVVVVLDDGLFDRTTSSNAHLRIARSTSAEQENHVDRGLFLNVVV